MVLLVSHSEVSSVARGVLEPQLVNNQAPMAQIANKLQLPMSQMLEH